MSKEQPKMKHEMAVEAAKDMLDKGRGMTEIINSTGLSEQDIIELKDRLKERL